MFIVLQTLAHHPTVQFSVVNTGLVKQSFSCHIAHMTDELFAYLECEAVVLVDWDSREGGRATY